MKDALKGALENLVKAMVTNPDKVEVNVLESARVAVVEIRTHPDDVGKVIGKRGQVIGALRLVARAIAQGQKRVEVEVVQPK